MPRRVRISPLPPCPPDAALLLPSSLNKRSHVPFTHHKSISNRAVVGDYETTLTEPVTEAGFAGVWCAAPHPCAP